MPNYVTCPLCTWQIDLADPPTPPSVQLAAALGMNPPTLAGLWSHQEAVRVENELDKHLRTHTPQQWLPQLMAARQYAKDVERTSVEQNELDTDLARRKGIEEGVMRVVTALRQMPEKELARAVEYRDGVLYVGGRRA